MAGCGDGDVGRRRSGFRGNRSLRGVIAILGICAFTMAGATTATGSRGGSGLTVGPRARPAAKKQAERRMKEARRSALVRAHHRSNRRQQQLERPEARAQRRKSRTAFHDVSISAARRLLLREYGEFFEGSNVNPAATIESQGEVVRYLSDYSAEVRTAEGLRVKSSSVPLRVPSGPDADRPVDLDLTRSGAEFTPIAPLRRVSIGDSARDGIAHADLDFRFAPIPATSLLHRYASVRSQATTSAALRSGGNTG